MIIDVSNELEYLKLYDNSFNDFIQNKDWLISAKLINSEVWFECYFKSEDYILFDGCYDYSSNSLLDVFDYCNSCIEHSFIYY